MFWGKGERHVPICRVDPVYAELILFKLYCSGTKEPHQFQKVIGELHGRSSIVCPRCGHMVDIKEHEGAIEDLIELATELDKLPRKGK